MKLVYRPDNKLYVIFDITYDHSGYPMFLIYRNGQWIRKSAKYFMPIFDGDAATYLE